MIVGGPPCQGFTSAGSRDWTDTRNLLLQHFVDFVIALRPTWFIMENVEGLLTMRGGSFIIEAITRLLGVGYWIRARKIYMEDYGLPQRRKRVIVVGNLEGSEFDFPPPRHQQTPSLFDFDSRPFYSLADAIGDLPQPVETSAGILYTGEASSDYQRLMRRPDRQPVLHHEVRRLTETSKGRICLLPQGGTMRDLPKGLQHPSFNRRAFRRVMDGTPSERRGGAPSGLKRMIAENPCLTITSAAPTEFIHPFDNRPLTLRECARIQSFPDWFEFQGSWNSVAIQIGNAIPPDFMRQLANHLLSKATWKPQPDLTGRWLGMEATKSNGISPALAMMLSELEARTRQFSLTGLGESWPGVQHKEHGTMLGKTNTMPSPTQTFSKEERRLLTIARTLGSNGLKVYLEDPELVRLCVVIATDLGYDSLVEDFIEAKELNQGYYRTPMSWFTGALANSITLEDVFHRLDNAISDFRDYFRCLCALHKHRRKFRLILEHQAFPQMEQIIPRCLLEHGMMPPDTLASWLVWRKWLYDIDNRSAQETGYLFEPILAMALGGERFSDRNSPVRRATDSKKGRQVDCILDKTAYEFKTRVTIAASGQGRFGEELDFARDCEDSGYKPVLLVLDPTPSSRLGDLVSEYEKRGGEAYIGDAAWSHIEEAAGSTMANFIKRYVKAPLLEIATAHDELMPIRLQYTKNQVLLEIGDTGLMIDRSGGQIEYDDPLEDTTEKAADDAMI